ncbi:MAG: hypothetical protein KF893_21325 [Caldilineaceae bacterium]|nr:hypothetical protein [Caldilineaceae bacterium]
MHILKKLLWLTVLAALLVACAPTIEQTPAQPAAAPTPVPMEQAEGVDLRIEIEESFLATTLGEQLAEPIEIPDQPGVVVLVQDPIFDLVPADLARLTASLDLDVYGITVAVRPTISLRLSVEDGQVLVSVAGVSLGDVNFPLDAVADQLAPVEAQVRDGLAGALQGVTEMTGLEVRSILIANDTLFVDLGR